MYKGKYFGKRTERIEINSEDKRQTTDMGARTKNSIFKKKIKKKKMSNKREMSC